MSVMFEISEVSLEGFPASEAGRRSPPELAFPTFSEALKEYLQSWIAEVGALEVRVEKCREMVSVYWTLSNRSGQLELDSPQVVKVALRALGMDASWAEIVWNAESCTL